MMDNNGVVAIIASKEADEESTIPIQSVVEASKAAAVPIHTPVLAYVIAAGEEALACLGHTSFSWDPYSDDAYIRMENPYDTSSAGPWSEVDNSDVYNDDESKDTKTRQVLRRLKSDQYNKFFVDYVYRCPFCTRWLHATDFNSLVKHAEDVKTCGPSVNVHAFRAKQKTLGFHLRNLHKEDIEEGRIPLINAKAPKVKGHGSKKWRKCRRDEAEALLAEDMRGH